RRLLLVQLAAVGAAVGALVFGFNIVLERTLDQDARNLVHSRADAELGSIRVEGGKPAGGATLARSSDSDVWVAAGTRLVERASGPVAVQRPVRGLFGGPARYVDVPGTDMLLYAAPVILSGNHVGTVVAGVSLTPY